MRRIVVTEFISLDGVIEDPGGVEGFEHGGWTFKFDDPEGMKNANRRLEQLDRVERRRDRRADPQASRFKPLESGTVILTYRRGERAAA